MKKLAVILGMITCIIGLSACGKKEDTTPDIRTDTALQIGETTVMSIQQIVQQGIEEQYAEQDIEYAGILSWKSALEDIGNYEGLNGGTATFKDDEIIIEMNVLGSDHNAVVEIILDGSMSSYMSITTNVSYSLGELMKMAALNTVIGMGTVFIVLILISLIISCFALISKAQGKQKKEAQTASVSAVSAPVVEQISKREDLSDDTELVAVIAAAIAAYEGTGSTDGFVVRSIRKSNKSRWQNV